MFGGGIAVFGKIALKEIPPFSFTFLRFFLASIFILPLFLKEKPKLNKESLKIIYLSLLAVANVVLFAYGIRLTTAIIGQMLYSVVPVIVGILSYFILKEKITAKKILGISLGLFGVIVIILLPIINKSSSFQGNLAGNLIIFTAVAVYSLYSVLSKRFQQKYSPVYLTSFFVFTATFLTFFVAISEFIALPNIFFYLSSKALFSTIYVSLLGTFGFYVLYQYAIKYGSPLIASMTLYLQPAATFVWAFLLLDERITCGIIIGAILAFAGAWITNQVKK